MIKGGGFAKTNTDTLRFSRRRGLPVWQACQWHSKYDLAKTPLSKGRYGKTYANRGKSISLSRSHVLTLEVAASAEYDAPRTAADPWTHLLIQQDFSGLRMADCSQLLLSFDVRLLYCKNRMGSAFNPSLHTAHAPFYLYLRNVNKRSADYRKSLWLGLLSFDYRDKQMSAEPTISWDKGTSMYIYQMPQREMWGNILFADQKWHSMHADIVAQFATALRAMKARGLFADSELRDFQVTGMNFGWEVPGTFDAALQVRKFSLRQVR